MWLLRPVLENDHAGLVCGPHPDVDQPAHAELLGFGETDDSTLETMFPRGGTSLLGDPGGCADVRRCGGDPSSLVRGFGEDDPASQTASHLVVTRPDGQRPTWAWPLGGLAIEEVDDPVGQHHSFSQSLTDGVRIPDLAGNNLMDTYIETRDLRTMEGCDESPTQSSDLIEIQFARRAKSDQNNVIAFDDDIPQAALEHPGPHGSLDPAAMGLIQFNEGFRQSTGSTWQTYQQSGFFRRSGANGSKHGTLLRGWA